MTTPELPKAGQPIVLRGGIVLTMDDAKTAMRDADVLVIDGKIAGVGPQLEVPEGTYEIDASGGIIMPGMIDSHRHMWQTAMRAYGADWTLTQYFVWYYLEHGKAFRPEDYWAGNALSTLDAIESGITTTVDWSHGLQSVEHAEAAIDALVTSPGRYVMGFGNIFAGPWEWTADPAYRALFESSIDDSRLAGVQLAFDVTGDPTFPEKAAFEVARDLGVTVTTHAGVWGATNDDSIRLMHEHGFMTPGTVYVHAATLSDDSYQRIAATGGIASLSTESEQSCGQGYPPSHALREHNIPISLSVDTSVWFSADLFAAMRTTLGADRSWEHLNAHEKGDTITNSYLRAQHVVEWATRGGAKAIGREHDLGSLEVGKLADIVLVKNDASPTMTPIINPYGHLAMQAGRGDVHTVLVGGEIKKYDGKLVSGDLAKVRTAIEDTVEHLRSTLGEETWDTDMNPDIPEPRVLDNPYMYTDYRSDSTHEAYETPAPRGTA
ncbi:amidohydrolase [Pseudoclavibacter endophyticus]|uniref:Amidohydrolase family protein n=1 Tax=Pseudoclavibacter endophyticus TaxID=1778590 RepID=A0A6H9WE85_9MICO|nr:amidohydrolase family protein [Pseudoclavibacter endophyticus]KAB1649199.1 amidohydrolase family protein [Pseudoclavibacter endophyticus]GGA64590.1 amidohydrolase [Pseudoclavibacter endophyticus]